MLYYFTVLTKSIYRVSHKGLNNAISPRIIHKLELFFHAYFKTLVELNVYDK